MTHICVGKLTNIGSDNGLSPSRRQAIIWTNAGILLIGPLETNFSEFLIGIQTSSFTKMHLKMSSAKWRPVCLGLNVLSNSSALNRQYTINTLWPRQNGRYIADNIFIFIFLNEKVWILIKISLNFVPKYPIYNTPALVQVMAYRRSGDKPLSEPMMVSLLMHICITQPQWVNWTNVDQTLDLNELIQLLDTETILRIYQQCIITS